MIFLAHEVYEPCTHIQKKLIKKIEKNSRHKFCRQIMVFWVHALTNVQPTSHFFEKQLEIELSKSYQS
jgi:hypothetical protein